MPVCIAHDARRNASGVEIFGGNVRAIARITKKKDSKQ